jgi:prepilin signal peptidase PulO-like enzyme (type II secretory pathway)
MDGVLLLSRLLLIAVFATAALAKLTDRAGSEKSFIDFGVPRTLAGPVSIVLPLVEIATAALLVPVAFAWWGAVLALALLVIFTAAIALNLLRGRRLDCHCFGSIQSEPASWRTVARNGILIAISMFSVWQASRNPGPSAVAWIAGLSTIQITIVIGGWPAPSG